MQALTVAKLTLYMGKFLIRMLTEIHFSRTENS